MHRSPPRELDPETTEMLRVRLGSVASSLPFASVVALSLLRPLGGSPERSRDAVVDAVVALALGRLPADALADDPALLASAFQNVDLLYQDRDPNADQVSASIMSALEIIQANAAESEPAV